MVAAQKRRGGAKLALHTASQWFQWETIAPVRTE